MKTIEVSITTLNLKFLITDILKEQKNPTSTISKRIYVYKANRTLKDPTCQSKGFKYTESSKPSNRRRKPNRGSNYNTFFKNNDDKVFKNVKTEFKSDPNLELKSFTYIIKNFDLNNNKSNCFTNSLNSNNNAKDSETKGSYLTAFNKSKKLLK